MNHTDDLNTPVITLGDTPTGTIMLWPEPGANGFAPINLCQVIVYWGCSSCPGYENNEIKVVANPNTAILGFHAYPEGNLIPAVGLTAFACAIVPAEETTWGRVKALYSE